VPQTLTTMCMPVLLLVSLKYALLSERFAAVPVAVQGPPGTGKTYTGVELCDILVRCSSEVRILVTTSTRSQYLAVGCPIAIYVWQVLGISTPHNCMKGCDRVHNAHASVVPRSS
jgi:hypothetical protein